MLCAIAFALGKLRVVLKIADQSRASSHFNSQNTHSQFTQCERSRAQHESSYQKQQDMHTHTHNTYGYQDFSLLGAKVPTENFRSRERKYRGAKSPDTRHVRRYSAINDIQSSCAYAA